MINSGCGLCVEVCRRGDRALFVRCEQNGDDVVVKDCLTPYIVAWDIGDHSWGQGSYFIDFNDAVEYLYNGSL